MSHQTGLMASPFHEGELQVQSRLGVREQIAPFAQKVIRDHMPDQHRDFFAQLPFLMLGTVDGQGRPWASLLPGRPGFVASPDARTLNISAKPLFGDPLNDTLRAGTDVGLLGIELATRRRNRMNGRVGAVTEAGFTVNTVQSFGNCPQYIQTRQVTLLPGIDDPAQPRPVRRSDGFDARARRVIEKADTLFIATAHSSGSGSASDGADVSHRGGKPGFVRVEDTRSFVFPDFSGNNHFNTIGNLVLNPKAGFLFPDFATGDLLYMSGTVEILWDGDEVTAFDGAERLLRFAASEVILVERSLPMSFGLDSQSPSLDRTGTWAQARKRLAAIRERDTYVPLEVFDIRSESDAITSFFLRRVDGGAVAPHLPGQFLPIRLRVPGQNAPVMRTYTLSDIPHEGQYRISVKREGGDALVSAFLHDKVRKGFRLEAMPPRGTFTLDPDSTRPMVFISAGVGITPMIAMTNHVMSQERRTGAYRPVHFIHGARNGDAMAFADHIRDLAAEHDGLSAHFRLSQPTRDDILGRTFDSKGHVDADLLRSLLPLDDYDFYLCGPNGFMQAVFDGLLDLGVRQDRIHYESFGPATVLKAGVEPDPGSSPADPVAVRFGKSDVKATWTPDKGTLLDLAEDAGLNPAFSCRTGVCGTCATRLKCGAVDYIQEPAAPREAGEVLICCAMPRRGTGDDSCGEDMGVVLDL